MRDAVLSSPAPNRLIERGLPAFVAVVAALMAGQLFAWSWEAGDAGWWWITHDRHAHYSMGMTLAHDVQSLDLPRLRHDLDALRVWGPLHPILEALVQLIAGPNHRFAILPSLAAWVGTIVLAFLVVRRMLPANGDMAGLAAAAILAALPGYRAFAADVMLESLGVMLTLLVLYSYLVAVQDDHPRSGIPLGVSLIALFFHKYNYWLIVVAGLVMAEFLRRPAAWWGFTKVGKTYLQSLLLREARRPLSWIALVVFVFACVVWLRRGLKLSFGEWHYSIVEPHNLFWVAFVAFFIRLCFWWHRDGSALSRRLNPRVRPVLVWHGWAAAMYFLLPKRLGYFFWFLSPAHSTAKFKSTTIIDGFWYYLAALREDYCVWAWQLGALLALLVVAVVLMRRLRPGSIGVCTVFAVGALLAMQYAMAKHRFAHTWAAPAWLLAVTGLFAAFSLFGRAGRFASVAAAMLIAFVHYPAYSIPGRAQESGASTSYPNPLVITNTFLPALADARHCTMLSNAPARYLFGWAFVEAHGRTNFATDIKHYQERLQHDPAALRRWFTETPSDSVVVVEILPHSPHAPELVLESTDLRPIMSVLREQNEFTRVKEWQLADGVAITLWKRAEPTCSTIGSRKGVPE